MYIKVGKKNKPEKSEVVFSIGGKNGYTITMIMLNAGENDNSYRKSYICVEKKSINGTENITKQFFSETITGDFSKPFGGKEGAICTDQEAIRIMAYVENLFRRDFSQKIEVDYELNKKLYWSKV